MEEAINALTEAIHEPVEFPLEPKKRQKSRREPSQKEIKVDEVETSLPPEEREDLGETLLFWKEYDSMPYLAKGLPAWHEDSKDSAATPPSAATPVPGSATSAASAMGPASVATPRPVASTGSTAANGAGTSISPPAPSPRPVPPPRSARHRDWGAEAAVQRRLVAQEQADWPSSNFITVDLEVQLRSKERLKHMLRTGQMARVKKELHASLPPVQRRPSEKLEPEVIEEKRPKRAVACERKKREGNAAEALRVMTWQRNELVKARRALESVVDRRRESDKKLEKLQKVLAKYAKPSVPMMVADAIHEHFHHIPRAIDKV